MGLPHRVVSRHAGGWFTFRQSKGRAEFVKLPEVLNARLLWNTDDGRHNIDSSTDLKYTFGLLELVSLATYIHVRVALKKTSVLCF